MTVEGTGFGGYRVTGLQGFRVGELWITGLTGFRVVGEQEVEAGFPNLEIAFPIEPITQD